MNLNLTTPRKKPATPHPLTRNIILSMPRHLLLLLLLLPLPACQGDGSRQPAATSPPDSFDRDTVQTYDLQTGEFHQQPPYGARSNQSQ
jgi:hypothetical protein